VSTADYIHESIVAVKPLPAFASHGWLAAVVPAAAMRFRVPDPDLAYTLTHAGARIVDDDPEVEIAPLRDLRAEAPFAIVPIGGRRASPMRRARQVSDRITASLGARGRAVDVRRELRRRGYTDVAVVPWDRDQVMRLPGIAAARSPSLPERFPRRMLVVASRRPAGPSALDHALAEAMRESGRPLVPTWPVPRASGPIMVLQSAVLRVAVGPGGHRLDAQQAALTMLADAPHSVIARRTPALLAEGRVGLARWTLEQRLPGRAAPHALDRSLLDECTEFAAALHGIAAGGDAPTAADQAETVVEVLPEEKARGLRALARRLDRDLAGLPRGFAHGDFCTSNLLVENGRLAGVIDWEGAGPARLPLLDLLHLRLLCATRAGVYEWGGAVTRQLLPAGNGPVASTVANALRDLGLSPSADEARALAAAYWLDRVSSQLGAYVERRRDRLWIERNVEQVVDSLLPRF
jgi:hypothetical protein